MFSPDSKFMDMIGRITDLILLNLIFLITCLPVFTMGAAVTAMYTVCFRLMREECSGIFKTYFRAFKDNFRQSTLVFLILAVVIVPAVYYIGFLVKLEGILRYACLPFIFIMIAGLMTGSYVFPWISQFENTAVQALTNALILSVSRLPRTLCILVINLMPLIVWFVNPELFLQVSFLWVALYFAAAAYMNAGLLWHVFKPYRTA